MVTTETSTNGTFLSVADQPAKTEASFFQSPWSWAAIAARIALVLWKPIWLFTNRAVQSTLTRDAKTLDYLYDVEATANWMHDDDGGFSYISSKMKPLEYLVVSSASAVMGLFGLRILFFLVDLAIAILLERLGQVVLDAEDGDEEEELLEDIPEAIKPMRRYLFAFVGADYKACFTRFELPAFSASLYLCSPILIIGSVYPSWQAVSYLAALLALNASCSGQIGAASLTLSVAGYIETYLFLLIIPCSWILQRQSKSWIILAVISMIWLGSMHGLSYLLVGNAYLTPFTLSEFTHPNLGTLWYFAMQVFQRFRDYFCFMFHFVPYLLVIPLALKLYGRLHPSILATIYVGLYGLFSTHPTLLDLHMMLAMMLWSPRTLAWTKGLGCAVSLCALPVPLGLYLMDCWMWLGPNSGNANFIYFQCLAYQAFVFILLLDFCTGTFRRQKALRVTIKLLAKQKEEEEEAVTETVAATDDADQITSVDVVPASEGEEVLSSPLICTSDQLVELARHVLPPTVAGRRWKRTYCLARDGDAVESFVGRLRKDKSSLLLVRTIKNSIFGVYTESPWELKGDNYYGSCQARLFRFITNDDDGTTLQVYRWTGANDYIQLTSKERIAIGGGGDGPFGLCLEENFSRGTTGRCQTFDNDSLCEETVFQVADLECFTFPLL